MLYPNPFGFSQDICLFAAIFHPFCCLLFANLIAYQSPIVWALSIILITSQPLTFGLLIWRWLTSSYWEFFILIRIFKKIIIWTFHQIRHQYSMTKVWIEFPWVWDWDWFWLQDVTSSLPGKCKYSMLCKGYALFIHLLWFLTWNKVTDGHEL